MQKSELNNQTKRNNRQGLFYMLMGISIGLAVPFFASLAELLLKGKPFGFSGIMEEYSALPVLMRIMPPLLLGGVGYFTWHKGQKVAREKEGYLARLEAQSKELERQNMDLKSLNDSLDNLVYTTSHDLKTPVVNFVGLLRMMKVMRGRPGSEEELDNIVQKLEFSADRMIRTIDDMVVVSRLEHEEAEDAELLSIKQTAEEVVVQLNDLVEEKGGEVSIFDEAAPQVFFSKTNLQALFQNLLSNAFQYAHPDRRPQITVSSKVKGEQLAIEVEDNGIGIDLQANEGKLFNMFTRLHSHSAGSGIGLYIVKKIMDSIGGEVQVKSQLNVGTTFILLFPQNHLPK